MQAGLGRYDHLLRGGDSGRRERRIDRDVPADQPQRDRPQVRNAINTQMLEELPRGMRRTGNLDGPKRAWEIGDGRRKTGVSLLL